MLHSYHAVRVLTFLHWLVTCADASSTFSHMRFTQRQVDIQSFVVSRCLAKQVQVVEAWLGWFVLGPWWAAVRCEGGMDLSNISLIPSVPKYPLMPSPLHIQYSPQSLHDAFTSIGLLWSKTILAPAGIHFMPWMYLLHLFGWHVQSVWCWVLL